MTVDLGATSGSVAVGDVVICRGASARVTRVRTRPPGHDVAPIRSSLTAVIVETTEGVRYLGADRAWIGADLRMHWHRGDRCPYCGPGVATYRDESDPPRARYCRRCGRPVVGADLTRDPAPGTDPAADYGTRAGPM